MRRSPGTVAPPETDVTARTASALETVFDAVVQTGAEAAALLARVAGQGRRPATVDLAGLRPGLHARLARQELVSGVGFVAAPGLLSDVPAWLEWWQTGSDGGVTPLLPDLDPARSAYSDYTHWDWFTLPRDTGRRAVAGPYVDYLCSDEYSLTLSAPVHMAGRFAGVAAADVYLRHFEAAVLPLLRRPAGARPSVNPVAGWPRRPTPHIWPVRSPRARLPAVLERGRPGSWRDLRLVPCDGVPLVLVVGR